MIFPWVQARRETASPPSGSRRAHIRGGLDPGPQKEILEHPRGLGLEVGGLHAGEELSIAEGGSAREDRESVIPREVRGLGDIR